MECNNRLETGIIESKQRKTTSVSYRYCKIRHVFLHEINNKVIIVALLVLVVINQSWVVWRLSPRDQDRCELDRSCNLV
jgi:hypothetical protein